MKKIIIIFTLLFSSFLGIQKSEAASLSWSMGTYAPGYGAIYLASAGTITYGLYGAAEFNGYATISNTQIMGSTVASATVSGYATTGWVSPTGYGHDRIDFDPMPKSNVRLDKIQVITTTPFKGKATLIYLPEHLMVRAIAHYSDNHGYENTWKVDYYGL